MKILQQQIRSYQLQERQSNIVAYRGSIWNRKGCPMVDWIIGNLYAKNHDPKSKDEQVIKPFSRQSGRHCGL